MVWRQLVLGCRQLHDHLALPLLPITQELGLRGIPLDIPKRDALIRTVTERIRTLDAELWLAGITAPNSPPKLAAALLAKGVPLSKHTKGGKQLKTDLDVLRRIDYHYNTCRPDTPTYPFLGPLIERKKLEKARSNLEAYKPCRDGLIRTSLKSYGTKTTRFSSSSLGDYCHICNVWEEHGTNLQNIPRDADDIGLNVKECFVAHPGWRLGELDYSALELRVNAYRISSELLIGRLEDRSIDLHTVHAEKWYGAPITKDKRHTAKTEFYSIRGGGGEQAVQIGCAKQGVFLEQNTINEHMRAIFSDYPEMPAWIIRSDRELQRMRDTPGELCLVRNAFGWPRILLGGSPLKEALATEISGTAAGIINFALLRLAAQHPEESRYVCLQIHDSLLVHVPEAQFDNAMRVVREEMEREVWFGEGWGERFVAFPVEMKAGTCWGNMEAYTC